MREREREREREKVSEWDNQHMDAQSLTFRRTLASFALSLTKVSRLR